MNGLGGEAFAPLLNYMYTGRLEVTLDNVYSVLLATHLLHMPGALEQCRAALLRLRAPPHLPTPIPIPTSASTTTASSTGTRGGILRPIPSRLIVGPPPLCWPPTTHHLYPPPTAPISVGISHLPQHHLQPTAMLMQPTVPPGIGIVSAPNVREKQDPCTHYRFALINILCICCCLCKFLAQYSDNYKAMFNIIINIICHLLCIKLYTCLIQTPLGDIKFKTIHY